jgi:UDP-3-O-[3-hydroxymyristoyl] glucosamine N-acyltransferase
MTLADIVARLGGRVAGDAQTQVSQVGTLENAGPGEIAFFSNPRYKARLAQSRAGAVVLAPEAEAWTAIPRIVAENPYAYFAHLSTLFNPAALPVAGIDARAVIAKGAHVAASAQVAAGAVIETGASIGEGASIGAGSFVGEGATIGSGTRLFPSVVVYPRSIIGSRVILHSGVVIGADGFGLAREGGKWVKIPQIGRAIVGDDVEVGANTTIDRGALDDTVIEDGVKLDNQIQIGHNCRVGAHTAMAGCVAVAGSAKIGRACTIGAGAIILGHLSIADNVDVSAATVISRSIHKAGTYTGMFPFDENKSWAKNTAYVRHLAELAAKVKALEKRLAEMEERDG